jgi:hypothetical protein
LIHGGFHLSLSSKHHTLNEDRHIEEDQSAFSEQLRQETHPWSNLACCLCVLSDGPVHSLDQRQKTTMCDGQRQPTRVPSLDESAFVPLPPLLEWPVIGLQASRQSSPRALSKVRYKVTISR